MSSGTGPTELDLKLVANPESVGTARQAAADLAAQVGAPVDDVQLAVSEAVGNAVLHAFRGEEIGGGTIVLRGRTTPDALLITVTDDGRGMSPNIDSPGLGLGISLITKVADDVHFDSSDTGTTVSMSFPI